MIRLQFKIYFKSEKEGINSFLENNSKTKVIVGIVPLNNYENAYNVCVPLLVSKKVKCKHLCINKLSQNSFQE